MHVCLFAAFLVTKADVSAEIMENSSVIMLIFPPCFSSPDTSSPHAVERGDGDGDDDDEHSGLCALGMSEIFSHSKCTFHCLPRPGR